MDKDRVKGTIDDAAGRAERHIGEWTGDTEKQVKGAVRQMKGKAEKLTGQVKDAVREEDRRSHEEDVPVEHERVVPVRH